MNFPLFHRPAPVAFLDDDPSYLEMLGMVLPAHWSIDLFARPRACIEALQHESRLWEADVWRQQQIVERHRGEQALVSAVLAYWMDTPQRYALTQVCVVDYSMPEMDGLQVLGELGDWQGSRVLLTGQADERIAVTAFNQRLIDQFIPKQRAGISRLLSEVVQRLLDRPHPRHEQIWRATLSERQCALLRNATTAADLTAWTSEHWVEYVVLGAPFGVLGLDAAGRAGWLQLESVDTLPALAELASAAGLPEPATRAIRNGEVLADLELQQCLRRDAPVQLKPALRMGGPSGLHAAWFELDQAAYPAEAPCYRRWLASRPERTVRD